MSGSNSSSPEKHALLDEPLGLTIHSLPQPQEAAAADAQRTSRGRLRMILVLLVCAAPVIASYFTYYVVRPQSHRSYGELVEPQRPMPDIKATAADGKTIALPTLKGQWLLVSVAGGACDSACERNLYLQRQLRESLGKDKDRMDWVWLVDDAQPVRDALKPALANAIVLRVDQAELARWLEPQAGHRIEDHLYVVDPMGHWMMRFTQMAAPATAAGPLVNFGIDPAAAAKTKRDLERLMRASVSWDKPGR